MPGYLCDLALFEDRSGRLGEDIGFVALWNWLDPTLFESAARSSTCVLDAEGVDVAGGGPLLRRRSPRARTRASRPSGLYACLETGELLHVLDRDGQTLGFYLGEPTPLVRDARRLAARRQARARLRAAAHGGWRARGAIRRQPLADLPIDCGPRESRRADLPPSQLTADDLDAYAGRYRSDELGEEMIVTVADRGHGLAARLASPLRRLLWSELRRLEDDLFYAVIRRLPHRDQRLGALSPRLERTRHHAGASDQPRRSGELRARGRALRKAVCQRPARCPDASRLRTDRSGPLE